MTDDRSEQTFTTPEHHDKSAWGDGPWLNEPDKIVWVDGATDLDCMIHRGPLGSLCGYVGVPAGHPLHGSSYDDLDVDVHGGLTYAAECQPDATPEFGICHVPQDGRPDDVWWFGFDCSHASDAMPAFAMRERGMSEKFGWPTIPDAPHASYKDVPYVRAEVRRLAEQLATISS
jgi:hypothetical protein